MTLTVAPLHCSAALAVSILMAGTLAWSPACQAQTDTEPVLDAAAQATGSVPVLTTPRIPPLHLSVLTGPVKRAAGDCGAPCDSSHGLRLSAEWLIPTAWRWIDDPQAWQMRTGIAVSYLDFGQIREGTTVAQNWRFTRGPVVSLSLNADMGQGWHSLLRLGVGHMRTRLIGAVNGYEALRESQQHLTWVMGLGLRYDLDEQLALELGLDWGRHYYPGLSTVNTLLLSAGLTVGF